LEVTLEANPGTIDQGILREYKEIGINRLSLGIQSFNDNLLKDLGRIHTAAKARRAIELSIKVGFDNFNIDLMYGLPGQTKGMCIEDLRAAVQHDPCHISYYQLTIEPHTPFYSHPPRLPSEESQWEMQELGKQIFCNQDYTQYEVSAFSRPGRRCKHNLNYWTFGDYLGIGAGAHGKWTETGTHRIYRNSKTRLPKHYIKSVQQGFEERRTITPEDVIFEFMLNALRLCEGFSLNLFRERTGLSVDKIKSRIEQAIERGLLTLDGEHLTTTELGKRFLDDLVMLFVPK
jgi:oxygen-independent coproporphyrinogen-3 oxidase